MIATQSLQLFKRLEQARTETDKLFGLLDASVIYDRPIAERHRTIFYVGHLEAFDLNLFSPNLRGLTSFDPALDQLFAFGIDPVDGGLPNDQPSDWPNRSHVNQYVLKARAQLDTSLSLGDPSDQLLNVAIEHRLMHAETLSYMLHQLPTSSLHGDSQPAAPQTTQPHPEMLDIPSGTATLGLTRDSGQFGWDNEFAQHQADVPAFSIDRYKVTNREYQRFVNAGGYEDPSLWTAEDWDWKQRANITLPVFWKPNNQYRAMFEQITMPLDWPVYVSHAEASAYGKWAAKRLPTESEWQLAASIAAPSQFPSFTRWDPVPVNADGGSGPVGMFGNGWEWTSTRFAPLPGFDPFPFYPGYSANFFDDKHYVLKGGSPRTAPCMLRPSFRNWFQPHYQYVYAGFRCAR